MQSRTELQNFIARNLDPFAPEHANFVLDRFPRGASAESADASIAGDHAMARDFRRVGISAQCLTDGTIGSSVHRFGDFAIGGDLTARHFGAEMVDAGGEIHKEKLTFEFN